jgi:hypothetical protein
MAHVYPLRSVDMIQILRCARFDDTTGGIKRTIPESTLSELLEDPLIRRLMTSDGVDPGELRALLADLSARLARDEALPGDLGQI